MDIRENYFGITSLYPAFWLGIWDINEKFLVPHRSIYPSARKFIYVEIIFYMVYHVSYYLSARDILKRSMALLFTWVEKF